MKTEFVEGVNMEQIRTASHIGLWIAMALVAVWLIYSATHTNTENNKFAPGSTATDNHSTRWPFTIDLNFSCSRVGLDSAIKKPEAKK